MREHAPPPLPSPMYAKEREEARRARARTRAASWSVHACASAREAHTCDGGEAWRSRRSMRAQRDADDSRKLQSSPSIREREGEGGETGGGGGSWGEGEARKEARRKTKERIGRWGRRRGGVGDGGWRQGEIEELLSDQHRTEKLFPAFELLHTRAFPSDGKAAPNGNRTNFSPATSVCAVVLVLSYARLPIRGFFAWPSIPIEVNF